MAYGNGLQIVSMLLTSEIDLIPREDLVHFGRVCV